MCGGKSEKIVVLVDEVTSEIETNIAKRVVKRVRYNQT